MKELRDQLELYAVAKEHRDMLKQRNEYYRASRGDTDPSLDSLIHADNVKLGFIKKKVTALLNDALIRDPKFINKLIDALDKIDG